MKPCCEIIVKDILPELRAMVCKNLVEHGLNQSEVANLLGISQPAVSQYLRHMRGRNHTISKNSVVMERVKKLCEEIYNKKVGKAQLNMEFCKMCRMIVDNCKLNENDFGSCMLCAKP